MTLSLEEVIWRGSLSLSLSCMLSFIQMTLSSEEVFVVVGEVEGRGSMEVLSTFMDDGRGEYWSSKREESGGEKVGKVLESQTPLESSRRKQYDAKAGWYLHWSK